MSEKWNPDSVGLGYSTQANAACEPSPEQYAAKEAQELKWRSEQAVRILSESVKIRRDEALMVAVRQLLRQTKDELTGLLDDIGAAK